MSHPFCVECALKEVLRSQKLGEGGGGTQPPFPCVAQRPFATLFVGFDLAHRGDVLKQAVKNMDSLFGRGFCASVMGKKLRLVLDVPRVFSTVKSPRTEIWSHDGCMSTVLLRLFRFCGRYNAFLSMFLSVMLVACGGDAKEPESELPDTGGEPVVGMDAVDGQDDVSPIEVVEDPVDVASDSAGFADVSDGGMELDHIGSEDAYADIPDVPAYDTVGLSDAVGGDLQSADVETPDGAGSDVAFLPIDPEVVQIHVPGVVLDEEGSSPDLQFKLPDGAQSVAFLVSSNDPETYLTIRKLVTPKGKPIVKPATGTVCIPCENRVVATGSPAAFLVPNNPDLEITKGTYTYRVGGFRFEPSPDDPEIQVEVPATNEAVDIVILYRTANVDLVRLPLTLWFSGSYGLTADVAQTDARLTAAISEATGLYQKIGLELVVEDYRDLDAEWTVIETTKGFDSDLSQLFAMGAGQPPERLQVFFVEQIFGEPDIAGIILGIAGGVPGPPFLPGSFHGGVAVAVPPPLDGTPDALGSVLAHEIGHFIGLFHVVEDPSGPYIPDPVADTGDLDTTNVMWWSVDYEALATGKRFSAGQGQVVRGYPQNQPVPADLP